MGSGKYEREMEGEETLSRSLDNVGSRPREVEEKKWVHGGDGYGSESSDKAFSPLYAFFCE